MSHGPFLCNMKEYLSYREMLITRLENGVEKKENSTLLLWKDVGILPGKLKIEQKGSKCKMCL